MCKLTKNLPIQGGCWIFRIQRGDPRWSYALGHLKKSALLHGHILCNNNNNKLCNGSLKTTTKRIKT